MSPDFDRLLVGGIVLGSLVLAFFAWRFGPARAVALAVVAGLFPAIMDFASSFSAANYVYPGQSQAWVFAYIFFGWIGVCGICLLLAEGILARHGEDVLSAPRLRRQAPVVAATVAVLLDLFIDPVAVALGYWVWLVPARLYYEIPLLNFVGWFVLMLLAPAAWIEVCRRPTWGPVRILLAAAAAVPIACVASVALSLALNGVLAAADLR
ncbi:carotenoid biosynthesis protein [Amaricoccus sp.]|uniref:carotenoid biosynthesis protein n=1 Tax=Amaricoccus sp. TaxID=1872485 RepID=UPI001B66B900|nr:carotenoid biosynthesis protein [Amaricoccus sp.]MBP7242485.1 carotenoid biosynthesis protein [Amaricoccus sp.]